MPNGPRPTLPQEKRFAMHGPHPPRPGRSLAIVLVLLAVVILIPSRPVSSAPDPPSPLATYYLGGNACAANSTPYWRTGDTMFLNRNVTVPVGCVLTIEPGAAVKADPDVHLYVDGQLQANGTSTNLISFDANATNRLWGGIQFNKTSRGSYLQYASIRMATYAVRAVGNPLFWGPTLSRLDIDRAVVGVEFQGSNGTLSWSRINYTSMAVHASDGGYGGYPIIVANTITTVLSNPAIAIYANNLVQPTIQANTIAWVNGSNGGGGGPIFTAGLEGGPAIGILVVGGDNPIVAGNTVRQILGGKGGNGATPAIGNGGRGGKGGDATGIVIANAKNSRAQTNDVSSVFGGHGGNGAAPSGILFAPGAGGAGGSAIAFEALFSTTTGWWFYNDGVGIYGGSAGDGGPGGAGAPGGAGGAAYAHFFMSNTATNVSNNLAQTVRGGYGGNGSVGGIGGDAGGIWMAGIGGSAILGSNTITGLTGGQGGAGNQPVATGGNATAVLLIGDAAFNNLTTVGNNQVTGITGGIGGVGGRGGSNGGGAVGIGAICLTLVSSANTIQTVAGGQGGSTAPSYTNGQGGPATGIAMALLPSASSSLDRVQGVTGGLPGSGGSAPPPSESIGLYAAGNGTFTSSAMLTNDTFGSVGRHDLYLDNYTRTTSLNTTFAASKLFVAPAANLTAQNFLAVKALWPDNVTAVSGARVVVKDNGVEVYNRTTAPGAQGFAKWIVVTNRVYVDSTVPVWNATEASVTYLAYSFWKSPRAVNMTVSQTQYFTMNDTTPPVSSANSLPTWTNTLAFSIHYSYSDVNGLGVANVTLWYRVDSGPWVRYAAQNATGGGTGQFSFVAPGDGTYEFVTIAVDRAGNPEAFPAGNDTWTIVDTTRPSSRVLALSTYQTSLSFTVSWEPDPGVTDILTYQIQYNAGSGWVTWLGDTPLTSGTFTASGQGVYAFRSIAYDRAGNTETAPAGNDTWTIVDTVAPASAVQSLPSYETSPSFSVAWGPMPGTTDIASYRVEVSDDGGSWTFWLSTPAAGSVTFNGTDGHRYAFRSLATDLAGNAESKGSGNDTWTRVDVTPPASSMASLPRYESSLSFSITWGPSVGTSDVASFTIYSSDNGGTWASVPGLVDTVATSATFVGTDGHVYAFRSLAKDYAGNAESKGSGNDTYTFVDVTRPAVTADAPEGAGTNLTPSITVTFNEAMDQASVQQAFSISPAINGNFVWTPDGRSFTFVLDRDLQPSTTYVIVIDTGAKDLAGNTMATSKTFNFTTSASSSGGGLSLGDLWPILVAVAVALGAGVLFLLYRRRGATEAARAPAPRPAPVASAGTQAAIDDVFLLYGRDGVLIKHETRRLRPDIDTDILSGMLTAVQQFVKDSFRGEEGEELNEMTVGQMHILIGRGKYLVLAATVTGGDIESMTLQIGKAVQDMEDHHWDQLEDWDGDMDVAKVFSPYVRKLIRGEYA